MLLALGGQIPDAQCPLEFTGYNFGNKDSIQITPAHNMIAI